MSSNIPPVEVTLAQIVAGTSTAPPGPVHVVGRDDLIRAIEQIRELRERLENMEVSSASKIAAVSKQMPGPL